MNYTIDASVFIASARTQEPHYAASLDFLDQLQAQQPSVFCPSLALAECSAAIARRAGNVVLAQRLVTVVKNYSGTRLIPLSIPLAERAAQIAAIQRLRGADSVYVAVAEEFSATLVTWDGEMLQRGAPLVTTLTPSDWLQAQQTSSNQPK
jgi:predicted nucleic acid-binding protein